MIPQYQTRFGKPRGNCFAACIASILEMPLDAVPNFCEHDNWRDKTDEFLKPLGLCYQDVTLPGDARDEMVRFWGYHVISGDGPRGLRHSVVGHRGQIVHDPHPDGGGVSGNLEYGLLVATDPAKAAAVDRFPKTANGMPVVLGVTELFWLPPSYLSDVIFPLGIACCVTMGLALKDPWVFGTSGAQQRLSECYSSLEAAEKAKELRK